MSNCIGYQPINIYEYEALAQEHLTKAQYDKIAGGATDEITLSRTRGAFDDIMLRPRMLVNVANLDTSTSVLGQSISHPIMIAPTGAHGRLHPDAELAAARAAGAQGTVFVLSSVPSYSLEEVAEAASGPVWIQQPVNRDRGLTKELIERAEGAGYSALCITLDSRVGPKRERDIHNKQRGLIGDGQSKGSISGMSNQSKNPRDPSATWEYLDWLVASTSLPVVAKGIMTGEDARLCAEHGLKGVIVSNHGARQIDVTFATVEVLPEVVGAVDGRIEVYLDGGIRRGSDVVKALALGARGVFIGRPHLWGLAIGGEEGVRSVIQVLRGELEMTMAMCGRPNIESIDMSLLGFESPLLSALGQPQAVLPARK